MSEISPANQSPPSDRPGGPELRKPRIAKTAVVGYSAGIVVATVHWLAKCYHLDPITHTGHWWFFLPDDALIEMWAFVLLPTIHMLGRAINNRLSKLAGEEQ